MTDIAFSSTVNASELKKSMVTNSTQPIRSRCARKFVSSVTIKLDCPGASQPMYRPSAASKAAWSITCESAIAIRISRGTIDSSA